MLVRILAAAGLLSASVLLACGNGEQQVADTQELSAGRGRPDEMPVMTNRDLPFRYPAPLYAQRVQGNVTLRLFIDTGGRALPESTRVEESSGYPPLDSAAVTGSQQLQFSPAKLRGEPVGVVVLFPVFFRHPEAAPLPGDTVVLKRATTPAGRP